MQRRWFLLLPAGAGCKAMDFEFDYAFMDGSPQTNTALAIRGGVGTLTRQAGRPAGEAIGLWRSPVSAAAAEALWNAMPAKAPAGPPLRPGMPNHLLRAKRNGEEKSIRLAHEPEILEQVRPLITALEQAQKEAGAKPLRTLAIAFAGWTDSGAMVELTAAGSEDVVIPDGAEAIRVMGAPEQNRFDLRVAGTAAAGEIRIPAGGSRRVPVAMRREPGMLYQAMYKRYGNTPVNGTDVFGDAASAMAPR